MYPVIHNIVLFGGGLDSTTVLLHLLFRAKVAPKNITLVHVAYGQKACDAEWAAAAYFAAKYGCNAKQLVMDLGFSSASIMNGTPIGVVAESNRLELRNVALLGLVASYAASLHTASTLNLGFHVEPDGSGFLDAKTDFLHWLQAAFSTATTHDVRILAPLSNMTRQEILELGYSLDCEVLTKSHTCYESVACGKCTHCVTKQQMVNNLLGDSA